MIKLSQLNQILSRKYVHLLVASVNFNFNGLYVCFPHLVRSSMGMAHRITKVSSFFTDCTFSHDCTSLNATWIFCYKNPQQMYDNRNCIVLQVKFKNLFLFLGK